MTDPVGTSAGEGAPLAGLHPVIRLLCFIVFAGFLTREGPAGLTLATLAYVTMLIWRVPRGQASGLTASLRMLRRMRWLFLSILIVYFWFTPGKPLWPGHAEAWVPTVEGMVLGMERILALGLIVLAVNLLSASTPREHLLAAVYWLARPLRGIGLAPERLALRMVLAMEAVAALQTVLLRARQSFSQGQGRITTRIAGAAGKLFEETLAQAQQAPRRPHTLPLLWPPAWLQWTCPPLLALAFLVVRHFWPT